MKRRPIAKLRECLEKRVTMYAMAASASGMGLLFGSQPAAAKIVYTKANQELQVNTPLPLDLNHDGVTDFSLYLSASGTFFRILVMAEQTNQVAGFCHHVSQGCGASALFPNTRVGPNQRFGPYSFMLDGDCSGSICNGYGPWDNVQHRYLGFMFSINAKVHYGWARLNVTINPGQGAVAILTGYAYETVPNKSLVTGKTKGPDAITLDAATLGRLARGASAIRE